MANCSQCGRKLPPFSFRKICQWCVQHEAEQRGEIAEDARQRVMPAPWVRRETGISLTQVLFGANVAVFLGMALSSGTVLQDFPVEETIHWGANLGVFTLTGEWWRLLTYMFLHGSLMHIGFNMWCLWDLGSLCESLYGRWTYLFIYLITGLAAGMTSAGWHPMVPSVGASGAIFGLAGALIASFALGEFSLPRVALRGTLRSLVFFVGFNVVFGSLVPGIDNAAHIGGLVSGLILGAAVAVLAPQQEHAPRRVAVFLLAAVVLAVCAAGLAHHYGFPFRLGRSPFSR
jgi:rhomboid protease GluP